MTATAINVTKSSAARGENYSSDRNEHLIDKKKFSATYSVNVLETNILKLNGPVCDQLAVCPKSVLEMVIIILWAISHQALCHSLWPTIMSTGSGWDQ